MAEDTRSVTIARLSLGGFVRFAACFGASAGLVVGVTGLVLSPFGVFDFHVTDRWGGFGVSGIGAGILFFRVCPVYFTLLLTIVAFPAYVPFRVLSGVLTGKRTGKRDGSS